MAETEKNKVHYDLQNVYVAPLTLDDSDAATFGTPERLYGAVGMDLSAQGDTTTLRADGILGEKPGHQNIDTDAHNGRNDAR